MKAVSQLPKASEKKYRDSIRSQARTYGWLEYTTQYSYRSPAGFPDLCLCHPVQHRLVFAELKLDGKEPTPEQREWLQALAEVPGNEVYLWHLPSEMGEVAEVITGLKIKEFV